MKSYPPSHLHQKLGTEHTPDKQMASKHRARSHDNGKTRTRPHSHQSYMLHPRPLIHPSLHSFLLLFRQPQQMLPLLRHPVSTVQLSGIEVAGKTAVGPEQEDAEEGPVDGASPVTEEDE